MFVGLATPKPRMLFLVLLGALRNTERALTLRHARTFSGEFDGMIIVC